MSKLFFLIFFIISKPFPHGMCLYVFIGSEFTVQGYLSFVDLFAGYQILDETSYLFVMNPAPLAA